MKRFLICVTLLLIAAGMAKAREPLFEKRDWGVESHRINGEVAILVTAPQGDYLANRLLNIAVSVTEHFDTDRRVLIHLTKKYEDQEPSFNVSRCTGECGGGHRIWIRGDEDFASRILPGLLHHVYDVQQAEPVEGPDA